jgi:hypothetical protein
LCETPFGQIIPTCGCNLLFATGGVVADGVPEALVGTEVKDKCLKGKGD